MSSKTLSIVMHTTEALVVLLVSLYVAHFFPEYKGEALGVIFGVLSLLIKGARVSDVVPVVDYVNPETK